FHFTMLFYFFFFFQAEDGIRDFHVTGVQTCALPILAFLLPTALGRLFGSAGNSAWSSAGIPADSLVHSADSQLKTFPLRCFWERSEERRVGKECRSRWLSYY